MMRRLYDWMMRMARARPRPARCCSGCVHRELDLSHPARRHADPDGPGAAREGVDLCHASATVGSVIGGIAGYAIGYYLFE